MVYSISFKHYIDLNMRRKKGLFNIFSRRELIFAGRQNVLEWTSLLEKHSSGSSNQEGKTILKFLGALKLLRKPSQGM